MRRSKTWGFAHPNVMKPSFVNSNFQLRKTILEAQADRKQVQPVQGAVAVVGVRLGERTKHVRRTAEKDLIQQVARGISVCKPGSNLEKSRTADLAFFHATSRQPMQLPSMPGSPANNSRGQQPTHRG